MQKQIEFYMSDENLKSDNFFHNLISSNKDHLVAINVLLNCKRIQKMRPSLRDLQEAIQASGELILSSDKTYFKRKKKVLPELKETYIKVEIEGEEPTKLPEGSYDIIQFTPALYKLLKNPPKQETVESKINEEEAEGEQKIDKPEEKSNKYSNG
jgi:hypothetical protein